VSGYSAIGINLIVISSLHIRTRSEADYLECLVSKKVDCLVVVLYMTETIRLIPASREAIERNLTTYSQHPTD